MKKSLSINSKEFDVITSQLDKAMQKAMELLRGESTKAIIDCKIVLELGQKEVCGDEVTLDFLPIQVTSKLTSKKEFKNTGEINEIKTVNEGGHWFLQDSGQMTFDDMIEHINTEDLNDNDDKDHNWVDLEGGDDA